MNSFDARVRYTKMIIEKTFLELLQKKHMTKITVTELCEKAQINRATFYKHYLDIPDLFEKLEEQLFEDIRAAFGSMEKEWDGFLAKMLYYTCQEKDRYFALGGENGDPNLMVKTFMVCYESVFPIMEKNMAGMKKNEREMLYQFVSHGGGGILTWWIHNGMKEPPEEVAQFILDVCSFAVEGMRADRERMPHAKDGSEKK